MHKTGAQIHAQEFKRRKKLSRTLTTQGEYNTNKKPL